MPSNWLYTDTNFPAFTGAESTEEKVTTIQNYLYMLVEQLRYTLCNLDGDNMNAAAAAQFTASITEPLSARIEDTEGNLAALTLTAQGLSTRVSDAEGNVSALTQTVQGFRLTASNGGSSSTLTLTSGGVEVSSAVISFRGLVAFSDLETAGMTTINGANITTGTISAINISGCTVTGSTLRSISSEDNGLEIYYRNQFCDSLVGGLKFDTQGAGEDDEAKYRMFLYTCESMVFSDETHTRGYLVPWALKLQSAGGMSLESGDLLYCSAKAEMLLEAKDYIALRLSSADTVYVKSEEVTYPMVLGSFNNPVPALDLHAGSHLNIGSRAGVLMLYSGSVENGILLTLGAVMGTSCVTIFVGTKRLLALSPSGTSITTQAMDGSGKYYTWSFRADGLYFNGTKVLDVS